jgi:predicted TIM-barrel fold metal-dependent hydrolase
MKAVAGLRHYVEDHGFRALRVLPWLWGLPPDGHIGVPWLNEMISLATKYPNVHIDTSAYTCARYPRELIEYMNAHGRRKVLFGSNHPFWRAGDCLTSLDQLGLDDTTRQAFRHGNADSVFRLT